LDALLTDNERAIAANARKFADAHLRPAVQEANRNETYDPNLMRKFGAARLLGAGIQGYGCSGMSYVGYGLVARELERVDSAYRTALSVQSSLVIFPIHAFGTQAQREHYLPGLASGELIGCFGMTEPESGSDPASMQTRAKTVPGGYVLNGVKRWITSSPFADVFIVWAKCDDGKIRGFILERGDEGLATPKIEGKFSLRAWATGEIRIRGTQPRPLWHRLGLDGCGGILLACRAPIWSRAHPIRPPLGGDAALPEKARRHADRDRTWPQRRAHRRPVVGPGRATS
jgi:glutaryl-CoA dehydrogenase